MTSLRDAARDLFLGGTCCGCGRAGKVLCGDCRAGLPAGGRLCWPTPAPAGLPPPWSAGDYAGVLRALVLGHKERRMLALTPVLGSLLSGVVASALAGDGPTLLVPVPSRAEVVRSRGHDATRRMVTAAARELSDRGPVAVCMPLLALRAGVVDQAGLDAEQRARNLGRSMWVPPERLRRAARTAGPVRLVVCDDVLTTGVTAREAQRALEAVGLPASLVATVAATRRHSSGRSLSRDPSTG